MDLPKAPQIRYTRKAFLAAKKAARASDGINKRRLKWMPSLWMVGIVVGILALVGLISAYSLPANNGVESTSFNRTQMESDHSQKSIKPADIALVVYITGEVKRPGVVRLAGGARVMDALEKAGGTSDKADLQHLNLARRVTDGEQIIVPSIETTGTEGGRENNTGGKISLNRASAEQLQQIDGIGPAIAKKIVKYRESNGGFNRLEQLKNVPGIGERKYQTILNQVVL